MIKDAYVYYAKFKTPALKYKQQEDKEFPFKNKEYVGDFLIPYSQLKALKKEWRKTVKVFQSSKGGISPKLFKERYKVDKLPPKEYLNEDGEYELIKFRKHGAAKDGTPNPPPELFGYSMSKGVDRNGLKVAQDTALGNGTLVNVQLKVRELNTEDKDQQLDLFKVQVIELIPYQSADETLFEDHDVDFEENNKGDSDSFEDHDVDTSDESEDDDFE